MNTLTPSASPRASRFPQREKRHARPADQRGAVLIIALVVLVAMTLSALALIQSVNTTNLISGNLAFREAAVLSAERATESAITEWIAKYAASSNAQNPLYSNNAGEGYFAVREDPDPAVAGKRNWDEFWNNHLESKKKIAKINTAERDAAFNSVAYVIHRLCDKEGTSVIGLNTGIFCSRPAHSGEGDSRAIPGSQFESSQVYYRITTRVEGPRNTVVYTQTIVAL